jgi:hypothetical protein
VKSFRFVASETFSAWLFCMQNLNYNPGQNVVDNPQAFASNGVSLNKYPLLPKSMLNGIVHQIRSVDNADMQY